MHRRIVSRTYCHACGSAHAYDCVAIMFLFDMVMNPLMRFLFPSEPVPARVSWLLLAARILFGAMFMSHGISKLAHFDEMWNAFPDPLGLGSGISLLLTVFAEVLCSAGFIAGALYRLALIPMIFSMCVAVLSVHGGQPFAAREPAVLYLTIFVLMYAAGAGRFSIDRIIGTLYEKGRPL